MTLSSKDKVLSLAEVCEDRKAQDIVVLDVREVTLVADYFLICNGTSGMHVEAISDHLVRHLKDRGDRDFHVEGSRSEGWILIDCGDILVHVFTLNQRRYYDLERLWGDAEVLSDVTTA